MDTEEIKRRIEFLKKEIAIKQGEIKMIQPMMKGNIIQAIFGGNPQLSQQQHRTRIATLTSEIRELQFQIEGLEIKLKKQSETKKADSHSKE